MASTTKTINNKCNTITINMFNISCLCNIIINILQTHVDAAGWMNQWMNERMYEQNVDSVTDDYYDNDDNNL